MSGDNPCNICNHKSCDGCILEDMAWSSGECGNDDCMIHYECGCLLSLDTKCKASTCFKKPGVYVMNAVEDEDDEE